MAKPSLFRQLIAYPAASLTFVGAAIANVGIGVMNFGLLWISEGNAGSNSISYIDPEKAARAVFNGITNFSLANTSNAPSNSSKQIKDPLFSGSNIATAQSQKPTLQNRSNVTPGTVLFNIKGYNTPTLAAVADVSKLKFSDTASEEKLSQLKQAAMQIPEIINLKIKLDDKEYSGLDAVLVMAAHNGVSPTVTEGNKRLEAGDYKSALRKKIQSIFQKNFFNYVMQN